MANGETVRRFVDFENDAEVPRSNVAQTPAGHFVIIAQVTPTFQYQKMSMESFVAYLEGALPMAQGLLSEAHARQLVAAAVTRLQEGQETQDGNIQQNASGLTSLQTALNDLMRRVTTLEHGSGGSSGPDPNAGVLRYGLRQQDGTVRRSTQVHYPGLPTAVTVTFPEVVAENDQWFFKVPDGVRVTEILNVGFVRVDEIGTRWTYTAGVPASAGPPPVDAVPAEYASNFPLTITAKGSYVIGLEEVSDD